VVPGSVCRLPILEFGLELVGEVPAWLLLGAESDACKVRCVELV
jgi:hypothetical protein